MPLGHPAERCKDSDQFDIAKRRAAQCVVLHQVERPDSSNGQRAGRPISLQLVEKCRLPKAIETVGISALPA